MLRSLSSYEPDLVTCCRRKHWHNVIRLSQSHPEQASPSVSAMNGQGTTALAIAVRQNSPQYVIEALLKANSDQIGVVHKRNGTVLHEALKHECSPNVVKYLLLRMRDYDSISQRDEKTQRPCLFGLQDFMGRTPLHWTCHWALSGERGTTWILFRALVFAYPQAIQVRDCDGSTPLTIMMHHEKIENTSDERLLTRMVKLLLVVCPSVATITLSVTPPKYSCERGFTTGDGRPNPLACALLYCQNMEVIHLLLKASEKVGVNACLTNVSQKGEVPLHIAVSMNATPECTSLLIDCGPEAVTMKDRAGLTPLDWIWIRFVIDPCSSRNPRAPLKASTRRYLPSQFVEWYHQITERIVENAGSDQLMKLQLWEQVKILLKHAAARGNYDTPWSPLHASCFVECPLGIVQLALENDKSQIRKRDARLGRLPLHYAIERPDYQREFPVGAAPQPKLVQDYLSPVDLVLKQFVQATHVADANAQLPLHIAIDEAKRKHEKSSLVQVVLSQSHRALERRDGKTKLYPFLQAAVGKGACTNTVYSLLREHPTLVSVGIL